jgi:hypothetical protein
VTILLFLIQFSADTSTYQRIKLVVLQVLPLTKDAVHVYIGCACLLAAASLLRWPLSSYKVLLPGLLLALAMEVFDLRDGWRQNEVHWAGSVKDIVNTNVIPIAIVLLARRRRLRIA